MSSKKNAANVATAPAAPAATQTDLVAQYQQIRQGFVTRRTELQSLITAKQAEIDGMQTEIDGINTTLGDTTPRRTSSGPRGENGITATEARKVYDKMIVGKVYKNKELGDMTGRKLPYHIINHLVVTGAIKRQARSEYIRTEGFYNKPETTPVENTETTPATIA